MDSVSLHLYTLMWVLTTKSVIYIDVSTYYWLRLLTTEQEIGFSGQTCWSCSKILTDRKDEWTHYLELNGASIFQTLFNIGAIMQVRQHIPTIRGKHTETKKVRSVTLKHLSHWNSESEGLSDTPHFLTNLFLSGEGSIKNNKHLTPFYHLRN